MKQIITTAFAILLAMYGYSQETISGNLTINGSVSKRLTLNSTGGDGGYISLQKDGVDKGYLQWNYNFLGQAAGNNLLLTNSTLGGSIAIQTNSAGNVFKSTALVVDGDGNTTLGGTLTGTSATFTASRPITATGDDVLLCKLGGPFNLIFGDGNVRYYSLYTPAGAATGSIRNFSTSTDILNWTAGGNVGIGTDGPNATLHIVDAGNSGVTTLNLNNRMTFRGDGVLNWGASADHGILSWDSGKAIVGSRGGMALALYANGTEKAIITANGNMGIGTSNPISIGPAASTLGINSSNSSYSGGVSYMADGVAKGYTYYDYGAMALQGAAGVPIKFMTNNLEVVRLTTEGKFGIGTNSPLERLVVKEETGSDAIAIYDGPGNKRLGIGQEASYTGNYIDSRNIDFKIKSGFAGGSGGNIIFMTQSNGITSHNEQMRIDKNGSVSIGTTNPQGYKLAVAGNVIAESVKVALQGTWPDYVFKSGHKLSSLQEVEKYVQENNHLPEMPSEAEVKKDGIDLGQMDAKLLKKIEELTLYMIDFKKEMDVIKAENQTLKKEVAQLKTDK
ncbi:MAG: hypothetical protein H7Y13_14635 [Sphingobacteriaceae bacterium]|nr:hypothetical protein [Sphingobacteriaceae bacterium]